MIFLAPKIFIGYMCAIIATLFWGFHAVIIRYLTTQGVPATGIASIRLLLATVILSIIIITASFFKKQTIQKFPFGNFFWIASAGLALNFLFFHIGLKYTIASDAILIEALSPVVVFVFVILFLPETVIHFRRGRDIMRKVLFIFLAGAIGSSLLLVNDPYDILLQNEFKLRGDLWEFVAMLFFALYMFGSHEFQRRNPDASPLKITAYIFLFGGLAIAPFVPWGFLSSLTSVQMFLLLVLGVFSTALTFALWQVANKYLDILPLVLIFSLSSVFTVIVESMVFGLEISYKFLLGGALVLGSSILTQLIHERRKRQYPPEKVL